MPKYPSITVTISKSGPTGNAFFVIGKVRDELLAADVDLEEVSEFVELATSGDYENVLKTAGEFVHLVVED